MERENIFESQSVPSPLSRSDPGAYLYSPVAVGHRVVHGGPELLTHQLITPQVLDELRSATHFAPLHIPQALSLIASAQSIFPSAAHFACFDDAFHQTMPEVARICRSRSATSTPVFGAMAFTASPTSRWSITSAAPSRRAIFAHLGNGASLCALRNGISIDTTMGLRPPVEFPWARVPATSILASCFIFCATRSSADEFEDLLNHQSGLFALSSGESDVKDWKSAAAPMIYVPCSRWMSLRFPCAK